MRRTIGRSLASLFTLSIIFAASSTYSKAPQFTPIDIQKMTRYDEDRVYYLQFEQPGLEEPGDISDDSLATLMIIKSKMVYIFEDGYDNPEQVSANKFLFFKGTLTTKEIWANYIDNQPDYVQISDRKVEIQRSASKEWVASNYKDFYLSVREKFLKKHVTIFLSLILNRKDTELYVSRKRIPRKAIDGDQIKYMTTVTARSPDGRMVYYAEDANGDNITETLTVTSNDSFGWGFKSGPNVVCIINNTQKDVENIIGKITDFSYHGSPEESEMVKKNFPTAESINYMINDIYKIDADTQRTLERYKINLEESVNKGVKTETKQ